MRTFEVKIEESSNLQADGNEGGMLKSKRDELKYANHGGTMVLINLQYTCIYSFFLH